MTSIATAAVTPAVVIVGRTVKRGVEPTAFVADADIRPSCKHSDKAQRDQDQSPVHSTSHVLLSDGLAAEKGGLMTVGLGDTV